MNKINEQRALPLFGLALAGALIVSGCASPGTGASDITASDPARLTHSGFLTNYARLKDVTWAKGIQCWRDPRFDAKSYDKVMIARIFVTLKPDQQKTIDPTDLKALTDYFHASLVKAIEPQMPIVQKAGDGVIVIRIALTDLVPTVVRESAVGTLVPYGFIAEAGSGVATGRPAGSTPYLGETGMEIQFLDGASNTDLAECRDTEIGRKYAADVDAGAAGAAETWVNGYMSSFESWSYARDAFDRWSALIAKRFAALRGVASPQ